MYFQRSERRARSVDLGLESDRSCAVIGGRKGVIVEDELA